MGGVVDAVIGGVSSIVGGIVGGMFGKQPTINMPTPAQPKTMPSPDDAAIAAAKKKSIAAIMNRSGRASTILSGDSDSGNLGV